MSGFRLNALRAHYGLTILFLLGVVLQFILAGFAIPSLGGTDIEPHRTAGFIVHLISFVIFLVALAVWKPPAVIGMSFVLAALATLQVSLPEIGGVAAALHPLNALILLGIAFHMIKFDRKILAEAGGAPATTA